MNLTNKTLKEKVTYFVESQRNTLDCGETFYDAYHNTVLQAFLKDYDETRDFIKTANGEEFDCFLCVLSDFIKKYTNEEIIRLCTDRYNEIKRFDKNFESQFYFDEEIEFANKIITDRK